MTCSHLKALNDYNNFLSSSLNAEITSVLAKYGRPNLIHCWALLQQKKKNHDVTQIVFLPLLTNEKFRKIFKKII